MILLEQVEDMHIKIYGRKGYDESDSVRCCRFERYTRVI